MSTLRVCRVGADAAPDGAGAEARARAVARAPPAARRHETLVAGAISRYIYRSRATLLLSLWGPAAQAVRGGSANLPRGDRGMRRALAGALAAAGSILMLALPSAGIGATRTAL